MEDRDPIETPVGDVLDLHAFAPRDARAAVEAYLEEARRLGLTALRPEQDVQRCAFRRCAGRSRRLGCDGRHSCEFKSHFP